MPLLKSLITARTPAIPTTKPMARGATAVSTVTKESLAELAAPVIAVSIIIPHGYIVICYY
jgi:hypothetical protein